MDSQAAASTEVQKKFRWEKSTLIIFANTMLGVLGLSVMTPAFPKMMAALDISPQQVGLLITVYSLPAFLLLLVMGVLADRYGRKRVIFPSLLLFGLTGAACAFTRDFNLLLALRFLQGLGAAPLIPFAVVILCDIYSENERKVAISYNASFISMSYAIFPSVGGILALAGWYFPFLTCLAAIPLGLAFLSLRNPEPRSSMGFKEYLGDVWSSLKNTQALGLFFVTTVTGIVLFGIIFNYLNILMGTFFGASSFVIGVFLSCAFLAASLTSSQLKRMSYRSENYFIKVSFFMYTLALASVPFMPGLWWLVISVVLFGVGHGFGVPGRHAMIGKLAPMKNRAAFMAVSEVFMQFGVALGPILMGAVFGAFGISAVFFAGAGLALFTFFLMLVIKE